MSVLASAGFESEEADDSKRPSVQVGDPFEEKRLIEASLELLDRGLVVGIQDLGGAGLTCATSETAARAGNGMDVDVSAVPLRELGMEPFEIMTSESQERMLAIVEPGSLDAVREVCDRWEVRSSVVGKVTGSGRLRILTRAGPDAACWPTCRRAFSLMTRRSTRGRSLRLPIWPSDVLTSRTYRVPEHETAATTFSRCSWTARGSTGNTTTSSS